MVLDARLVRVARGLNAAEAANAFAKSLRGELDATGKDARLAGEFQACLEGMFLMAAVDGEISEAEMRELEASLQAVVDLSAVPGLTLHGFVEDLNGKLARDGWRARLDAVVERLSGSSEARASAFRLAAGVAFVDDHVAHGEAAAIDAFAAALGLDPERSQAILREVHEELFG